MLGSRNSPGFDRVPRFRRVSCAGSGEFELSRSRRAGHGFPQAKLLLADAEFRDDRLIALGIVFLEVVEQATPLADQHEKAAARAVVFLVRLEVLRQLPNALAQQRDLNFRASGIGCMRTVLVNEGFLLLSG
jgi:hypothetical protein